MSSAVQVEPHPSSVFSPHRVFLVADASALRVVTLWLSYDFDTQEVWFDIYGRGEYQRKAFDTLDGAKQYLLALDHEFPAAKIPVKPILTQWESFFNIEGMVGITADVQHVSHWCAHCDNFTTNSFSFLYFPAVPGTLLDEAFLSLKLESGCGMKEIVGKFQDVSGEVQTTLSEMIAQAEDSCKGRLSEALSVVETQCSSAK